MMHTREGEAATELVLETFRANGRLLAAGDGLAANEGLTSARWQVIGAIALAEQALTVPQIARRMGLTRQSVQASVNRLRADELLDAEPNPDHGRSPLIRLTASGRARYAALERRQVKWINEIAEGIAVDDLVTASRVLARLSERLEATPRRGRKER
jgi:DNA-binding MarR family transcriptional regulator